MSPFEILAWLIIGLILLNLAIGAIALLGWLFFAFLRFSARRKY
jgi:hypothetical protein